MKVLITGVSGFVGPHLKKELEEHGYDVYGLSLSASGEKNFRCDITKYEEVFPIISALRPNYIFHLAGFSSVAKSFAEPEICYNVNVNGTKNLLDAIVKANIKCKILIVSSGEVYGKPMQAFINEDHPLAPVSPYGKSRLAQEKMVKEYIENSHLEIIVARSFNHTGPGQLSTFAIPSFKKQIENSKDGDTMYVGNIDVIRDFSDVRDVVKVYRLLMEKNQVGEVYNVGSGKAVKISDILKNLIANSGKNIKVEIDPKKFRPADVPSMVADITKLRKIIDVPFRDIA